MVKIIWFLVSNLLIYLIFSRVPKNEGLRSFTTKTNFFGSPNSTEKFLNNLTIFLILIYIFLAFKLNLN